MSSANRRAFIQGAAATGMSAVAYSRVARAAASEAQPVIGFIGCGGRATSLLQGFRDHTQLAWACDVDENRAGAFRKEGNAKQSTGDLRRVLDDSAVDAVVVATPDHWHAPAAIMACDAGKHVYVEKPCSHNFREGEWLVEAAQRNKVTVQHGTQSRTNPLILNAIQLIEEGLIGEVLMCKAWNVQRRKNIGKAKPSATPAGVDYDTWVGPAEFVPFQANRFHYDWHWWHNFGTGDLGNDGTHELDIARWGLGVNGLPSIVSAVGGKFYFDDDQQFPDTATCVFQWSGNGQFGQTRQLIFEMRIWSKSYPHNCDSGIEFYGTEGMLFVSKRGKLAAWNHDNQPIKDLVASNPSKAPANHQVDFLQAFTQDRPPAAEVAIGHDSCSLVHLANTSLRVGRSLQIDHADRTIKGDAEATKLLSRSYREGGHWSVPT